ncbi:MAG: beta-lactamase family protein [Bacteroidales bacterium]|nr:beta-lactamase family protein [Bacteroidales bacterium]
MKKTFLPRTFLINLLVIFLFFASCTKYEDDIQPDNTRLNEKIQALTDQTYADYLAEYPGFPGGFAIRVMHNDETGFGHQGFADNFSESIHFRGQSTTKSFTAAGIVLLYQRGLLHFDSLVTAPIPGKDIPYLPDTEGYNIPFKDKITIWQLLNHTAGVYDLINHSDGAGFLDSIFSQNPEFTMTIDLMTSYISEHGKFEFEPGEGWVYSNSGYQLLAKIIERVSGKSIRQFMEDEFIKPLALNETSFPDMGNEQTIPEPYLDSWAWLSGEPVNLTTQNMSANVGEGNIITSARDLSKFYQLLLSGQAGIKMAYVSNYMMACVPISQINSTGYGMGLFNYKNLGYGHGGDGSGISVRCYADPANNFTVFVLTNCWNFNNGENDMSLLQEQSLLLHNLMFETKKLVLGHYK